MKNAPRRFTAILLPLFILIAAFNLVFTAGLYRQTKLLEQKLAQTTGQELSSASQGQKVVVEESAVIDTVKKIKPSVVSIIETKDLPTYRNGGLSPFDPFSNDPFFQQFFPKFQAPQQQDQGNSGNDDQKSQKVRTGGGSGFIYSTDGLIMTNRHVVADEGQDAEYTVILADGTELSAEVVARDTFTDAAVVKIQPKDGEKLPELTPVTFGDSSALEVGQRVVAVGNALAEFQNTVTTGIISAIGREITASSGRRVQGEQLTNLLQTDAAINPGNSGGPLVNLQGEVVGMNTAIASGAEGIGFAIPVNDLKKIADSVQKTGKISRPYLGVRYMMLDEKSAKELNLDVNEGALLIGGTEDQKPGFAVLKDSPGEKAGLREKDVILSVDGEKLTSQNDLRSVIAKKEVGQEVEMEILREGKKQAVQVKLEEAK